MISYRRTIDPFSSLPNPLPLTTILPCAHPSTSISLPPQTFRNSGTEIIALFQGTNSVHLASSVEMNGNSKILFLKVHKIYDSGPKRKLRKSNVRLTLKWLYIEWVTAKIVYIGLISKYKNKFEKLKYR